MRPWRIRIAPTRARFSDILSTVFQVVCRCPGSPGYRDTGTSSSMVLQEPSLRRQEVVVGAVERAVLPLARGGRQPRSTRSSLSHRGDNMKRWHSISAPGLKTASASAVPGHDAVVLPRLHVPAPWRRERASPALCGDPGWSCVTAGNCSPTVVMPVSLVHRSFSR